MLTFVSQGLREAWSILSERDDKPAQVALALCVIILGSLAAGVAAFAWGLAVRSGDWSDRIAGGFVALLSCVGAFSVGGMLGLLFGSPTVGSSRTQGSPKADVEPPSPSTAAPPGLGVRPNTSLERIADWLTTMIVGLGLVHLGSLRGHADAMSVWLTRAITANNGSNGTPGMMIALGFAFAGFMLIYLWSLRFLPSELRNSYEALKARAESAEAQAEYFKAKAMLVVPPAKLAQLQATLTAAHVDAALTSEVVARYRISTRADSEPMQDFGPEEDRGYRLNARVADLGNRKYEVTVELTSPIDGAADKVFWLLHNSFTPEVMSDCPITAGTPTTYTTVVDEAFWVGAIVPVPNQPSVHLAISLAAVPGVPAAFIGKT
jgi:hypothetical protein